TLDRTTDTPGITSSFLRLAHELGDHSLTAFVPGVLANLTQRDANSDLLVKLLNEDPPIVLPGPAAFARRLYYLHDEREYGLPVAEFKTAADATMDLLAQEELQTIMEFRFTPDTSVALMGPGTAGRGKGGTVYVELATPFGQHSELRIAEVFEKLHELLL